MVGRGWLPKLPKLPEYPWKEIVLVAGLAALLTTVVEESWWLYHAAESVWVDELGSVFAAKADSSITVVTIRDEEFRDPRLFASTSPLHPAVLDSLLERISWTKPAVIAVDIRLDPASAETPERAVARLRLIRRLQGMIGGQIPVVLVGGEPLRNDSGDVSLEVRRAWDSLLTMSSVPQSRLRWASDTLELDRVRGIVRMAERSAIEGHGKRPSFLEAIETAYRGAANLQHGTRQSEMLIRYSGEYSDMLKTGRPTRMFVPAIALLSLPREAVGPQLIPPGQVVLLGAVHQDARDDHWTPLGAMPGAFIWAEAIGTAIRDDAPREVPLLIVFLIAWGIGILFGCVLHSSGLDLGTFISLAAVIAVMFVAAFVAFKLARYFIVFLPELIGVMIHHYVKLRLDLAEKNKELKTLKGAHGK